MCSSCCGFEESRTLLRRRTTTITQAQANAWRFKVVEHDTHVYIRGKRFLNTHSDIFVVEELIYVFECRVSFRRLWSRVSALLSVNERNDARMDVLKKCEGQLLERIDLRFELRQTDNNTNLKYSQSF
jgi:hypothetical protein